MTMVAIFAALGSALLVGAGSVLQHRAGRSHDNPTLRRAFAHPMWVLGAAAGLSGFALHVVALSNGALAVVQPLLVSGLLFALPLSVVLEGRRIRTVDVLGAVAVVGGLVIFQRAASPSRGRAVANSGTLGWCVGTAVVLLVVVGVVALWRRWPRDVVLGLGAGIGFGVVAALLKSVVGLFMIRVSAMFLSWPLYAFVVVVAAAIAVNQLAFNAGPLARSLPLITIIDPLVAVIIGAVAFGESISAAPLLIAGQCVGFVAMATGVVVLSRRAAEPMPAA